MDLGLELNETHRVLEFDQSLWLKEYIDFNTQKRTQAKNSFAKDILKPMNNSVFGKTMENIRKRVDVRFVTDKNKLLKLTSKPTYVQVSFSIKIVSVHKIKEILTSNRPAYVGMYILDLGKTLMHDFHNNYIKQKYGDKKAKLLFTDTDSLTYETESKDV